MARLLLIVLLLTIPLWLSAQVLNGRVYRAAGKDTIATIAGASVYYSGSMLGTLTNAKGEFALENGPGKMPLIVSCVGYYSTTLTDYGADKPLKVYLKPKVHELREVHIGFDGMSREEKERIFKREFLGISEFALSCSITNMADVQLDFNKKTGTLKASCDNPIHIENKKLGYSINYFLDRFVRTPANIIFAGNYIFADVSTVNNRKKTLRNRADAYNGSRMEFIRALWSNTLKKAHYKIYLPNFKQIDADSIICLNSHLEKVINLKYKVLILHNSNVSYPSYLSQRISDCYINENGFYDTGLLWFGDMGVQRVGDMLPFEYKPVTSLSDSIHVADSVKLVEKDKEKKAIAMGSQTKVSEKALKDFEVFNSIVLSPKNLIDRELVIKKWTVPIRYKVYGRFGADKPRSDAIFKKVDDLFAQLSKLTGLPITKTEVDSDVNFYIVTQGLDKVKDIVGIDAMGYLENVDIAGGEYSNSNDDGFSRVIELVRPVNLVSVRRQIMNGLGFTGIPEGYIKSIFYDHPGDLPDTIQQLDARIIQTLYNPAIKAGMTEPELDAVLLKLYAGKKVDLK